MKKLLGVMALASLVLGLSVGKAHAGAPGKAAAARRQRVVSIDGNGHELQLQWKGYKVYTSTGSGAQQVVDEDGNTAVEGVVHQVCISSSANGATGEYAQVFDSSGTAASVLTSAGNSVNITLGSYLGSELAVVIATPTATACITVDAQFHKGLVLGHPAAHAGASFAYWTPVGTRD